jgi:hypothetical protein
MGMFKNRDWRRTAVQKSYVLLNKCSRFMDGNSAWKQHVSQEQSTAPIHAAHSMSLVPQLVTPTRLYRATLFTAHANWVSGRSERNAT